jgi:hypothetical protein
MNVNHSEELNIVDMTNTIADKTQDNEEIIVDIIPKKSAIATYLPILTLPTDLTKVNNNLVILYNVIKVYYKHFFKKYEVNDYFVENEKKVEDDIKQQLIKLCSQSMSTVVREHNKAFNKIMEERIEDIKTIVSTIDNDNTNIATFVHFYYNLKYVQREILQEQLTQVSKFDTNGLFLQEKFALLDQQAYDVLQQLHRAKNDYNNLEKTLFNQVSPFFWDYYVHKRIKLFDEEQLGGKENKKLLLKLILLQEYNINDEFRWIEFFDRVKALINTHFLEFKDDFSYILINIKDFKTAKSNRIHLGGEGVVTEERSKWAENLNDSQNLYALFCLFVYFSNSQQSQLFTINSRYTATSRLILQGMYRNFKNGSDRHTNFQILCLMEHVYGDIIHTLQSMENANKKTIPIKSLMNIIREIKINDDSTQRDLHAKQRDGYKASCDYKGDVPNHFFFEKLSSTKTRSKHIIVCVSGFMSQVSSKDKEWEQVVNQFPLTEVFALHWSASSVQDLAIDTSKALVGLFMLNLESGFIKKIVPELAFLEVAYTLLKNLGPLKDGLWTKHYEEAVKTGKFLAHVLAKSEPFDECCISFMGFSLGTVVVANCLWELENLKCHNLVYDVMFMGGVADSKEFEQRGVQVIADNLINIYSKEDWVINYLLKAAHWGIYPVGKYPIQLNSPKIINIERTNEINGVKGHMKYRECLNHIFHDVDFNEDFLYLLKKE